MIRFKVAILEIYNMDEPVAMLALKRELWTSWFTYFLDKKPSKTYLELLAHARKNIRAKVANHTLREFDGGPLKKQARGEPSEPLEQKAISIHREAPKLKDIPTRDKKYIPLLILRAKILNEIEGEHSCTTLPH